MSASEAAVLNKLSLEEVRAIERAMARCHAERDSLIRQIGKVYVRGMCDMLRVQGRLSEAETEQLLDSKA